MKKIVDHLVKSVNLAQWIIQSSPDKNLVKAAEALIISGTFALDSLLDLRKKHEQ